MFKHLLVAVDESEPSGRALALALRLAAVTDGSCLTALLVVPDYATPAFVEAALIEGRSIESLRRSLADAGRRRLQAVLARHGEAAREIEAVVSVADDAHAEIVTQAEQRHCDLIVMGSRGRGAVRSALLGSQTVRVLAATRLPVLAVH